MALEFLVPIIGDHMAPIMFIGLVVFLLSGYPVAFALAANGLLFGLLGIGMGMFTPDFLQALPNRIFGIMANDTLLAIPFFTFMGLILERSGMAGLLRIEGALDDSQCLIGSHPNRFVEVDPSVNLVSLFAAPAHGYS